MAYRFKIVIHPYLLTGAFLFLSASFFSCSDKKTGTKEAKVTASLYSLLPSDQSGVTFNNAMLENNEVVNTYEYRFNGAGLASGDINNDGLPDLFFAGTNQDCKLYLNKGDLRFEDITTKAGIFKREGIATGVTFTDVNGDGFADIYVCRTGKFPVEQRRNLLYINNGDLTFTERAGEYGLDDPSYSNQAVFFDIDNDNDQDMYLVNQPIDYSYANTVMMLPDTALTYNCGKLFRNDGTRFTDISKSAGVYRKGFGFNASVADVNRDGWLDLYVTNDYMQPDYFYINNGDGTFTESLKKYLKHCSNSSMGSCIADYNNDGLEDIFVVDMIAEDNERQKLLRGPLGYDDFNILVRSGAYYQYMRNTLQLNNGNGTFSEIGQLAGVSNTDWSWGPILADLDNDGWKDLFIANGYRRDLTDLDYINYFLDSINKLGGIGIYKSMSEMFRALPETPVRNYAYKNNKDLTYSNQSETWGFKEKTFSNGSIATDLDNDGDLEIILNNIDQPAMIYECHADKRTANNFVQFRLKGIAPNTLGAGAKVEITTGALKQMQTWFPAQGYMSSVENRLHFGLGEATRADTVLITWPGGAQEMMTNIPAGKLFMADQKNAALNQNQLTPASPVVTLFEDITNSTGINFDHSENEFVDFKREPLLPQRFSEPGPALAVEDVNGDGLDDVFFGGAIGHPAKVYLQNQDGSFRSISQPAFENDKDFEDAAAAMFDADNDGDNDLYVCSGGNEYEEGSPFYQDRLYLNNGKGMFSRSASIPEMFTSTACVTAGDPDGDGDTDLFVGGRIIPWKYPQSPRSYLLINSNGTFRDATADICPDLLFPGLVTTALWSDYNNDKKTDLIVAGQWMPVKVFRNTGKKLELVDAKAAKLEKSDGWWNTIAGSDIDGDGDTDYFLGNRGNNSRFQAKENEPATVTANDFDGNGTLDALMCYYVMGKSYPIHGRDQLTDQIRPLKNVLLRYKNYANATLQDIFPKQSLDSALTLYAYTFSSSYMRNNGNGTFTLSALPLHAQFSSVKAIVTGDYDGDGITDVLLAGNDYSPDVETGRYDASIGCFLKGDGKGGFKSLPVTQTGYFVDGYVKGMAAVKTARGKLLVVARNNEKASVILHKQKPAPTIAQLP